MVRFKGPILALGLGDIAYLDGLSGTRDELDEIISDEGLISNDEPWCTVNNSII